MNVRMHREGHVAVQPIPGMVWVVLRSGEALSEDRAGLVVFGDGWSPVDLVPRYSSEPQDGWLRLGQVLPVMAGVVAWWERGTADEAWRREEIVSQASSAGLVSDALALAESRPGWTDEEAVMALVQPHASTRALYRELLRRAGRKVVDALWSIKYALGW